MICGTMTTGLWWLLENFFGVDEDIDVAKLEDAASLAHYLRLKHEEKVETPSVLKEVAEEEDAVEDVFIDDTDSISSSQVTSSKDPSKCTLAQMKAAQCTVPFTVQPFAYTSCTSRLRAPQGSHRMGDQWHQL